MQWLRLMLAIQLNKMSFTPEQLSQIRRGAANYHRALNTHKKCLYPNCQSNKIIRAHSVSKAQNLVPIAEDSHVTWTHFDNSAILESNGRPELYLNGINRATTFKGFCAEHDLLFAEIDQDSHSTSPKALFLHAYRTLAAECWWATAKREANIAEFGEETLTTMTASEQIQGIVRTRLDSHDFQVWTYFKLKELFDEALLNENWSALKGYEIDFKSQSVIASTIGHNPHWTFDKKEISISIFNHIEAPLVFLFMLPLESSSKFIAVWHEKTDPYIRPFIDSLNSIPDNRKSDAILRLFFMQYGNLAINPIWWRDLDSQHKEYLSDILYFNLSEPSHHWSYIYDIGIEIEDWGVSNIAYIN